MVIRDEFIYCADFIDNNYLALESSTVQHSLYVKTNNDRFIFENPVFSTSASTNNYSNSNNDSNSFGHNEVHIREFLSSIPIFNDLSDSQLLTLEQKLICYKYQPGEIIFKQGEEGDKFYVIRKGSVNVLVQINPNLLSQQDYGRIVNRLNEGCHFGERALMRSETRAATIQAIEETVCYAFSRTVYQDVISGSTSLISKDTNDDVDWSKDHETRSLFSHIENILKIDTVDTSPKIKRILYELSTAFTPELSPDEILTRMVMTVKSALKVDRVGLFVISEDKRSMILKVSEGAKGVRLPIRGLAGAVLQTNQTINIADAYQDPRFDPTMDRRTGYRTRQVLSVPLKKPIDQSEVIGVLQINNKLNNATDAFTAEQQSVLESAAQQLSELLDGRADVFIHSGVSKNQRSFGQGVGDGMVLLNTSDLSTPFEIDINSVVLGPETLNIIGKENFERMEVEVSLFLALTLLCEPKKIHVDSMYLPRGSSQKNKIRTTRSTSKNNREAEFQLPIKERLVFNIDVRDLPRATRVMFKIIGYKKKSNSLIPPSSNNSLRIPIGWAACIPFDFKGCLEYVQELNLFNCVDHEVHVPINTTLSNLDNNSVASISCILSPDLVLAEDSETPRVRIVHTISSRSQPLLIENMENKLTDKMNQELNRILKLSFNPMSMSIITQRDKDFMWSLRHSIFHHSKLLPAFLMCIKWNKSDHVQELYDLLDLWAPATPVVALQLLDRRFMDPKVRAYAVHCLEELPDDELALYMLQLCQQLKFENFIDSALSRFLLRRALANNKLIGHIYFWLLQSEVYNKDVSRRYVILLQAYIRNCGAHRIELGQQMFVMRRLEKVAEIVKKGETKEQRKNLLTESLNEVVLPSQFKLPLNPHLTVTGINIAKCRVMESKKKPLWLTLNVGQDGPEVALMLKVGDDLRQDSLIMQLLRVMNDLWKREGLDMQMQLYDCISTGYERGLLQVVLNATTLGNILMDATDKQIKRKSGSLSRKINAALKAINDFSVISDWLKEQVALDVLNPAERPIEYEQRVLNFLISTAAYCVASYVLGLGDRHNDNLMLTKSGHFFHIDFGHILGNFKSKMGVKRERAPFVFTHAMKEVMETEERYESFVDLCCDIYNILREHSVLLVSLFSLAIPCNLPELREEKDVMWIYEKLLVGATEEEASEHFRKQLEISLNTRGTRLNDAAHMLAHA